MEETSTPRRQGPTSTLYIRNVPRSVRQRIGVFAARNDVRGDSAAALILIERALDALDAEESDQLLAA